MTSLFVKYGIPFVSGALTARFMPIGINPLEVGALMAATVVAIDYFYSDSNDAPGARLWIPGLVYFGASIAVGGLNEGVNGIVGAIGTEALIATLDMVFTIA